jgi:nicastrin
VAVVPEADLPAFLKRVKSSAALGAHVKAVLVDGRVRPPGGASTAPAFPNAALAVAANRGYKWNPWGSGLNREYTPLPMHLLDPALAEVAVTGATRNGAGGFAGRLYMARSSLTMYASGNSRTCLAAGTCLPLGGHSVLASMPPLPSAPGTKDVLLVTARMDSDELFHDVAAGADAPLSGLITMLAAMRALSTGGVAASTYAKQVVFLALNGEAFDLMGSRSFLYKLGATAAEEVAGLTAAKIVDIIEVGMVGRARTAAGATQLYYHTTTPGTLITVRGYPRALFHSARFFFCAGASRARERLLNMPPPLAPRCPPLCRPTWARRPPPPPSSARRRCWRRRPATACRPARSWACSAARCPAPTASC